MDGSRSVEAETAGGSEEEAADATVVAVVFVGVAGGLVSK